MSDLSGGSSWRGRRELKEFPTVEPLEIGDLSGGGGERRERSTSTAYTFSSDSWNGDTPQTPPSPLRSLMQTEKHSVNTPSKDKGFTDVIAELHDIMMKDVQRRKSSQQQQNKEIQNDNKDSKDSRDDNYNRIIQSDWRLPRKDKLPPGIAASPYSNDNYNNNITTQKSRTQPLPLPLFKLQQQYQQQQQQQQEQDRQQYQQKQTYQDSPRSFCSSDSSNPFDSSSIRRRGRSGTLQSNGQQGRNLNFAANNQEQLQKIKRPNFKQFSKQQNQHHQHHHRRGSSQLSNITEGSDIKLVKPQLKKIQLNSILNRELYGCKGESPRCLSGKCACQASASSFSPSDEPRPFVFRLKTSEAPPDGRRPIRISDGLNPAQPFDFSRFELPPRRPLFPFSCAHVEMDGDRSEDPETDPVERGLARWEEKHNNPFARSAEDLQFHVRMQNLEPKSQFKHPIFPEYDGCLTLPLVSPGIHFKDVKPMENSTLQESAMWASSRPKAVINESVPSTPRHIRIFNQLGLHNIRSAKPPILSQVLLGNLTQLQPEIYRLINGDRWSLDEKTMRDHPELYVFTPKKSNPGGSLGRKSGQTPLQYMAFNGTGDGETKQEVLSFKDPRIKDIFSTEGEASISPSKKPKNTDEDTTKDGKKQWPVHFAILRSYQHAVMDWPDKNILARGVQQRNCPQFDGKGGQIYLEEHTFHTAVELLASKDPLLAPMVQDVTAPMMKKWLELIEPAYTGFEGNRHIPMSSFIPTPMGFGRWAEFRYVPATGHWILYFFPKPHDWDG